MLQTWTFGGSLNACTVESAINNAINDVKFITLILGYWNLSCTKLLYWLLLEWSVFILALENTKMALYARNASYSRPRVTHVSCWKIVEIFRQDNWKIVEFINFAWGLTFHFELDHYVLHKIPLQKSSALKCQMKCWSRIKRVNLHFSETFFTFDYLTPSCEYPLHSTPITITLRNNFANLSLRLSNTASELFWPSGRVFGTWLLCF